MDWPLAALVSLPCIPLPETDSREVKRLIRRSASGACFTNGAWTQDRNLAQSFSDTATVIAACLDFDLRGVEMVIQMGEAPSEQEDIIVQLFPAR
jgi:hypothetical protein